MENNKVQLASKRDVTFKLPISSTNGQNIEGSSKQVKLDDCSFDVPLLQERTCGSERRVNCSSVTRPMFDLNVAEAALEDSDDKITERSSSARIELGGLRSKSSISFSSPIFAMKSDGSDSTLRRSHLSQSTDRYFDSDSGVDLDLQLKPPCKPGPKFSWLDAVSSVQDSSKDMAYLTLSLPGEVGPTTSVNPEPNEGSERKKNREVELGLHKSMGPTNVKAEQCEISTDNAESIEASSICLRRNCSKEGKNESKPIEIEYQRHKGLQASSPHVKPSRACREDLPDSYGIKILDSESKGEIDLNRSKEGKNESKPLEIEYQRHKGLQASSPHVKPSRACREDLPDSYGSKILDSESKGEIDLNCSKEEKNESKPLEIEYQRHKGPQASSPHVKPSRACREDLLLPDSYGSKILDSESKGEIDLNCSKEEKNESKPLEIEYQRHKGLQASSPHVKPSRACREDLPDSYGSKILDSESKCEIDLNFMSADARDCMLHDDIPMHIGADVTLEASKITEKGLDQASHSYIQNSSEPLHYCDVPKSSCLNDDGKGKAEKALKSVSESLKFEGDKLNEANDTQNGQYGLDHGFLQKSVATDGNKAVAAGVSHGDISSESKDLKSSKIVAAEGALMELDGTCDVRECSEKIEASAKVDEGSSSDEYEYAEVSADGSEYEAVDLTVPNDEGENSVEQAEENDLEGEDTTSYTPVTGPSMQPLNGDEHDVCIKNPDGCVNRDLGISTTEDPPLAFQTSGCSEKRLVHSTCRENDDSNDNARATARGGPRNVSWQEGNAYRKDFVESGGASKQEKWRGKRGRFIKQYNGPNRSSFTKTEPDHSRPMSSHNKGGRFFDDPYRQDKSRFHCHREKSWYPKSETEKHPQQFGRRRPDIPRDRPDIPRDRRHFDWVDNVDAYASRTNCSFGGDRPVKRCFQDETPHPSYSSSPRQAHNASERHTSGVQNASHYMLRDSMEEHPSYSHPRQNYEQVENTRRILSPLQHGPVHSSPPFPNSSLRSSDKSLQAHDRHAGLVHHRASPPLRHNRMPLRRHYFAGEKFDPQNQVGDIEPYVEYGDHAGFVNDDRRCIERQDVSRPFRQQHYVEQEGPFVIDDSARRPNMYHPQMVEELERGSHFTKAPHRSRFNDDRVKRRRY